MLVREKIFFILSFVVLVIFSFYYIDKIEHTNFNWFSIPKQEQVYLLDYDKEASNEIEFKVYSSASFECETHVCSQVKKSSLDSGINYIVLDTSSCPYEKDSLVNLTCGNKNLFFHFKKSSNSSMSEDWINLSNLNVYGKDCFQTIELEGNLSVKNSGYKILHIILDGKEILSPQYYFRQGLNILNVSEKISVYYGEHELKVVALNQEISKNSVCLPNHCH